MVHPPTYPEQLPDPPVAPMHCPACDRMYDSGVSEEKTLEIVKKHVTEQHPEYDEGWADA